MFVNICICIIYEKYVFSAVSYNSKNYNRRKYFITNMMYAVAVNVQAY